MTRKQVERLVAEWQKRLGLGRWRLTVEWDKSPGDDCYAAVYPSQSYEKADLRFDPAFVKWTPRFTEEIVVHELLHLHHRDVDRAVAELDGQLQGDAQVIFDRRYEHEKERFVDCLALLCVALVRD